MWAGLTGLVQNSVVGFCGQADESLDFIEIAIF
jgi:hypothetical protein